MRRSLIFANIPQRPRSVGSPGIGCSVLGAAGSLSFPEPGCATRERKHVGEVIDLIGLEGESDGASRLTPPSSRPLAVWLYEASVPSDSSWVHGPPQAQPRSPALLNVLYAGGMSLSTTARISGIAHHQLTVAVLSCHTAPVVHTL